MVNLLGISLGLGLGIGSTNSANPPQDPGTAPSGSPDDGLTATGCQRTGKVLKDLDFEFTINVTKKDGSASYPLEIATVPNDGGFFFPLTLGARNSTSDQWAQFQLSGAGAYTNGGLVLSTDKTTLLFPAVLYDAADSRDIPSDVAAIPSNCNGKDAYVLRFLDILGLPTGRGSVQKAFAPGSGVQTPLLLGLLDLVPVDLIIVPVPGSNLTESDGSNQKRQFKQF